MRKDITTTAISLLVLTALLGLAYPLATTGVAKALWPNKSEGSQITLHGRVVGSRMLGQDFSRPVIGRDGKPEKDSDGNPVVAADPRYFQSRPSADAYNPAGTFFNNLGPNSKALATLLRANMKAYLDRERLGTPGLRAADVPADAVQTSASGVDPHISQANARIQARRVARVRHMRLSRITALVDANTDGRGLGVLGEPGVNVLQLNLALDKEGT
jgi:K+-transporting ATPase ATPase C chain